MTDDGPATLARDDVLALLEEVGAALVDRGLHANIYVVGGAALSLTLDVRRITRDVDAVFRSGGDGLRVAVEEVASRHGLDPAWLNDHVRTAIAGAIDDIGETELAMPGLAVALASPEHLLAMKMLAGRDRDVDDLVFLFGHLGITAPDQAVAITERVVAGGYAEQAPPVEYLELLAEDVLARIADERRDRAHPREQVSAARASASEPSSAGPQTDSPQALP